MNMWLRGLGVVGVALLAACGSLKGGTTGTFSATLGGAGTSGASLAQAVPTKDPMGRPSNDLSQVAKVIVNLSKIQLVSSGGAMDLKINPAIADSDGDGNPDIDLMKISSNPVALVSDAIPAGSYSQFRLFSPSENGPDSSAVYLVLKNGSKQPLRIPSGQQTGLKIVIDGGLNVQVDATTTLTLSFDLAHSLVKAGNSGKYMLKPVVKASGNVTSGKLTGTVSFADKSPVSGAGVEAKSADNTYTGSTDAAGLYTFPVVVAPASYTLNFRYQNGAGVVYQASKTQDVPANATTTVDAEFAATGGIAVKVSAAVALTDVSVVATAADNSTTTVTEADSSGNYVFPSLAPGSYTISVTANGGTLSGQAAAAVDVLDGQMAQADVTVQ